MHFLYLFILQFLYTLHVSNDHFVHHQEFINLLYPQLRTNRALSYCSNFKTEQLDTFRTVCTELQIQ